MQNNTQNNQINKCGIPLENIQQVLLASLLEIDRICRKHHIQYFLGGGTLLGAVRHGGFIPWDDDVDIMMTRKEFDRLSRILPKELPKELIYQSPATDPFYHSVFHKVRLNGTAYSTQFSKQFPKMHQGLFIDIFAHDAAPNSKYMQKVHIFLTLLARSLVFHKWEETPMHFYGKNKLFCRIATFLKNKLSMRSLEKLQNRILRAYNDSRHSRFYYDGTGEHLRHGVFPKNLLNKKIYMDFEGYRLPVPEKYHEYLVFSYGTDYMTPVPPSERVPGHEIIHLDLGVYSGKTCKEIQFRK